MLCSAVTHQQEGCGWEEYGVPGPGHLTQNAATGLSPWEGTQAGLWVLGELLWAPLPVLVDTIPACFKVPAFSARSTWLQCRGHHAPPGDEAGKVTLQRAQAGWHSQRMALGHGQAAGVQEVMSQLLGVCLPPPSMPGASCRQ